jgi:hypothetical protein
MRSRRRRALLLHFSGWLAQTAKFCQLGNHAQLFFIIVFKAHAHLFMTQGDNDIAVKITAFMF